MASKKMSTAESITRDFLTCTICYDIYKQPKCLPCLHTFCQGCLSSYIISQEDLHGVKRKGYFPCPICRTETEPPKRWKPISLWAADFKSNFYIENLKSTIINERTSAASSGETYPLPTEDIQTSSKVEARQTDLGAINGEMDFGGFEDQTIPDSISPTAPYEYPPRNEYVPPSTFSFGESVNQTPFTNFVMPYGMRATDNSYQLEASVLTRIPGDYGESRPCGICLVHDIVVVLDFNTHRIKTFKNWRESDLQFEFIDLPFKSTSITKISPSNVAVTGPSHRKIFMIQIWPRLEVITKVVTAKRYVSLACTTTGRLTGLYRGTFATNASIDTIDYNGTIVSSVELAGEYIAHSVSDSDIFTLVRPDSKHIDDSKDIDCFNENGIQLYRIVLGVESKDIRSVYSYFGDICVPDFDGNVVRVFHKKSGDLTIDTTTLTGVQQPMDVHAEADGTLFVACWDGYVRVYSLKKPPMRGLETSV